MALQPLSAPALADSPTLFASFMGAEASGYKTVGELLDIYRARTRGAGSFDDRDDDLRVDRFMADMAREEWSSDVVIRIGVFDEQQLVIDGIHRGIAYLGCVRDGIRPERLPALRVDC